PRRELFDQVFVIRPFIAELVVLQSALGDGRAVRATDLDADGDSRIHRRRAGDRAERAALEDECAAQRVLNLDLRMDSAARVSADLLHRPGDPLQQIDAVHRLVHDGPAAIPLPRAAPTALPVVLVRAIPRRVTAGERERAEAAVGHRLLQYTVWLAPAVLENARQPHALLRGCVQHAVDAI